ncbi:MAG TPA: aspartyl protease family protein [Pyrinomonadaceae bacterium]|jgi:predicted aspartyl protease|nr:aspartyl protease family protein [Pyrinomonadaceae bacterium]
MRSRRTGFVSGALAVSLIIISHINGAASHTGEAALLRAPESPGQSRRGDNGNAGVAAQGDQRGSDAGRDVRASVPRPVSFREVGGRGLLVRAWVNGEGPYSFAVDTGAGATILSRRVAAEARVGVDGGRALEIGGLSGASVRTARRAHLRSLAIGESANLLPANGLAIVAEGLPPDVDGILDPTEAFSPLGYVIDLPRGQLRAFNPRLEPLRRDQETPDGTVVAWLTDSESRRPFVMLAGGRRALLDTGSSFGLAVTESSARAIGINTEGQRERGGVRDIAGGEVRARRLRPATVYVGSLALRGVPTDLLFGAEATAPVLLGRDALRPFQLTFDPLNRLIRIRAL